MFGHLKSKMVAHYIKRAKITALNEISSLVCEIHNKRPQHIAIQEWTLIGEFCCQSMRDKSQVIVDRALITANAIHKKFQDD